MRLHCQVTDECLVGAQSVHIRMKQLGLYQLVCTYRPWYSETWRFNQWNTRDCCILGLCFWQNQRMAFAVITISQLFWVISRNPRQAGAQYCYVKAFDKVVSFLQCSLQSQGLFAEIIKVRFRLPSTLQAPIDSSVAGWHSSGIS